MAEKKAKKTTSKAAASDSLTASEEALVTGSVANLRAPMAACAAELIGTFLLAASVIQLGGQPLPVMFALIAIVLIVGQLSGAYLNPALVFGAWVTRRITGLRAIGYVIAQFVGAMLAVVVLTALLDKTPTANPMTGASEVPKLFAATAVASGREWVAFFAEVLGMTIFGFAVAAALQQTERISRAFMVGGGLLLGLFISGSTVVLNPAVALSIQALNFTQLTTVGIYTVGAFIGGALGFFLHKLLAREVDRPVKTKA